MVELAIPAYICEINDEERSKLEYLFIKFNHARRRAYSLLQKGLAREEVKRKLQVEEGVNSRYADDAIYLAKDLPPHVTFGGKRNQKGLMKAKINKKRWRELTKPVRMRLRAGAVRKGGPTAPYQPEPVSRGGSPRAYSTTPGSGVIHLTSGWIESDLTNHVIHIKAC